MSRKADEQRRREIEIDAQNDSSKKVNQEKKEIFQKNYDAIIDSVYRKHAIKDPEACLWIKTQENSEDLNELKKVSNELEKGHCELKKDVNALKEQVKKLEECSTKKDDAPAPDKAIVSANANNHVTPQGSNASDVISSDDDIPVRIVVTRHADLVYGSGKYFSTNPVALKQATGKEPEEMYLWTDSKSPLTKDELIRSGLIDEILG